MKLDRHHKKFQLNGNSFSSDQELLSYAHDFSKELYGFFETWFSKDPFILVNTSGSTGVPKEIMLQKEQMIHSAFATGKYFDLEENTTALLCLSANFIAGKMMLVRALILGWKLDVVLPDASPLKNIQKEYDFSAMVPLQLENSIHSLHLIKTLIVGGGVVSIDLQGIKKGWHMKPLLPGIFTQSNPGAPFGVPNIFKNDRWICCGALP